MVRVVTLRALFNQGLYLRVDYNMEERPVQ
jgi:hypothetical protein